MITLNDNLLLAKGSERACYNHPYDKTKLIKVLYHQKGKNNQNNIEKKYYKILEEKEIRFTHISKYYGTVLTNLGEGLIFEKIVDYTGKISKSLRDVLKERKISICVENILLNELKSYLLEYNIIFADPTSVNVLCQEFSKNNYKLIIVDGLGAKKDGIKFKLYNFSNIYVRYKVLKQWNSFTLNIERIKSKIRLNQKL